MALKLTCGITKGFPMPSVYQMKHEPEVEKVLEAMRLKLAQEFGVTVTGNRCTVRWNMDGQLVDVHMIIENVSTPTIRAYASIAQEVREEVPTTSWRT
jgi:hypothetical protein